MPTINQLVRKGRRKPKKKDKIKRFKQKAVQKRHQELARQRKNLCEVQRKELERTKMMFEKTIKLVSDGCDPASVLEKMPDLNASDVLQIFRFLKKAVKVRAKKSKAILTIAQKEAKKTVKQTKRLKRRAKWTAKGTISQMVKKKKDKVIKAIKHKEGITV